MSKYFGTDGIRGIANEQLTVQMALKIGQYLGYFFKGKNIVIGCDTRLSKDMINAALSAGITSAGANVYNLGIVPTPCVSYFVKNYNFACGIVISASHNPYYDNGIKIFNDQGEKISGEIELEIEKYIDDEIKLNLASHSELGMVKDYSNEVHRYLNYLMSTTKKTSHKYKIALDASNGAASFIAQELFEHLGYDVSIIHNEPNGVNINKNCGSTSLQSLSEYVVENNLHMGFAFDGDADRMLAVDSRGHIVDGDLIMYICAKSLLKNDKLHDNTVVTTIMSNIGLYKALDKACIKYTKTAVGDKYVYENMVANNYSLGGEQSGHIIFSEYATTGDGILSAIQVLDSLERLDQTLEELLSEVTIYPQLLQNVKVKDKNVVLESKVLAEAVKEVESKLEGDGRVLLRPSGTEPLIRVMVEASTTEKCETLVNYLVDIVTNIK